MKQQSARDCILIVDDDIDIGNMLEELLVREGYAVIRAYSGTEAVLLLQSFGKSQPWITERPAGPDLILLDLMLPGLPGEQLLPLIQGIPVIVVSARAGIDDKVSLLLTGAADYITKPFDSRELLARVAVQLRKKQENTQEMVQEDSLRFEDLELLLSKRMAMAGGHPVKLTRTEYAILKILMINPMQVVPKSVLLERISEDTPDCMESSLKVHVSNLRKKLREMGGREYIEAVWGIGFKMKTD